MSLCTYMVWGLFFMRAHPITLIRFVCGCAVAASQKRFIADSGAADSCSRRCRNNLCHCSTIGFIFRLCLTPARVILQTTASDDCARDSEPGPERSNLTRLAQGHSRRGQRGTPLGFCEGLCDRHVFSTVKPGAWRWAVCTFK